jgi:hypothetical protein
MQRAISWEVVSRPTSHPCGLPIKRSYTLAYEFSQNININRQYYQLGKSELYRGRAFSLKTGLEISPPKMQVIEGHPQILIKKCKISN